MEQTKNSKTRESATMFEQLRSEIVNTPELKAHYERTKRTVILIRKMLMLIDAERERAGISKSELARRIGADPSAVRRLFTSENSNPTLRTVIDMLAELEISVKLTPPKSPKRVARRATKQQSRARRKVAA